MAQKKCEAIALTLGARGALLTTRDRQQRLRPPEVEVVSAVGAGDSFLGAMTFALANDRPLEEAFRYGLAAGTAAVLTPGTELCRKEDVEKLFGKITASG